MLPLKDNVPTRSFPLVTLALIAANVIVWIWEVQTGVEHDVLHYGYYPCSLEGPCVQPASLVPHLPWYEGAFSSMFMHGGWLHIAGNMLFLWIFGNNVCASLMVACAKLGASFVAATPEGYEPAAEVVEIAREAGGEVELTRDPQAAAEGADVLYTDVWTSMGQDEEREQRLRDLDGFGIDEMLVRLANDKAIVLHCLPAHYGEEITEDVLYGPQSAVWDQAENRLHAQKALMALVIS